MIVWDIPAGKRIGLLPAAVGSESKLLLSNDARFVAIQDPAEPRLIELWKLVGATYQRLVIALPSNVRIFFARKSDQLESDQAAFSPDGSLLAATGDEGGKGAVWLWETETGREAALLRDNALPVWSGDGRLLATFDGKTSADTSVNVWAVTRPTPTYLLPKEIDSLTFSPDGNQLISGGSIWDVVTAVDRRYLRPSSQQLPGPIAGFTNGDQLWAVARPQYPIRLHQLAPEKRELTLEDPGYPFFNPIDKTSPPGYETLASAEDFAISPDGKFLAMTCNFRLSYPYPEPNISNAMSMGIGDPQETLELWDLVGRKRLAVLNQADLAQTISCLRFSPDGKRVATCGSGKKLTIWDGATGEMLRRVDVRQLAHVVAFSPDAKLIFSAGNVDDAAEGAITVIEAETGRERGFWTGHRGAVLSLAISRDSRLLASGGKDRTIRLWETTTGHELARWEAHLSSVNVLAFSPDGQTLASGGADGALKLWGISFIRRGLSALGLDW